MDVPIVPLLRPTSLCLLKRCSPRANNAKMPSLLLCKEDKVRAQHLRYLSFPPSVLTLWKHRVTKEREFVLSFPVRGLALQGRSPLLIATYLDRFLPLTSLMASQARRLYE